MADVKKDEPSPGFKVTDRRGADREPAAEPSAPAEASRAPRPPIDFTTFVLSFASTALIQMGAAPDPDSGQLKPEPELARETIDLLGMLREKTRGNLTDDEQKFFDALLYDLRVRFVEITRKS